MTFGFDEDLYDSLVKERTEKADPGPEITDYTGLIRLGGTASRAPSVNGPSKIVFHYVK